EPLAHAVLDPPQDHALFFERMALADHDTDLGDPDVHERTLPRLGAREKPVARGHSERAGVRPWTRTRVPVWNSTSIFDPSTSFTTTPRPSVGCARGSSTANARLAAYAGTVAGSRSPTIFCHLRSPARLARSSGDTCHPQPDKMPTAFSLVRQL